MLVTYNANYTLEYSYKETVKLFGGLIKEYPVNHYNDKLCFKGVCKDSAVKISARVSSFSKLLISERVMR